MASSPLTPASAARSRPASAEADESSSFVHSSSVNPIRTDRGFFSTALWCWRTCLKLLSLLGIPGLWLLQFMRLVGFVLLTLPVLGPEFVRYLTHPRVYKNIVYGPSIRHQLDI
jgi:hypothetical protein